ncbi:MAG: class I SAM-dependent methyltransferase [Planctomycetes bacterium]|nr:class I SAM-dependent methyltransferase [Planctomycetota bacterium]
MANRRDVFVAAEARQLPAGAEVLDVGAGPCRYRPLFGHCRYKAQDFAQHEGSSEGPLAEGANWQYGRLDFVSDATAIPCPDASFDAIVCTEVLEHVPEPDRVLHEFGRLLRPGGRLILTAPLGSGLHQEPHHFFGGFTPYFYQRVLGHAGFTDIAVMPNGGFYSHHAQESQRFNAWLDPRRLPLLPAIVCFPLFLLSLPWCRIVYPLLAPALDLLDLHKGFTAGYHVTARRGAGGKV